MKVMNIQILIPQIDNGKSKITVYDVDGKVIEVKYNYGKGYGFSFLTKFKSLDHYKNRMHQVGEEQIYSSTLPSNCTQEGREIELAIMKHKI